MELAIGSYVSRALSGRRWHIVESIVADDAITKCGRRLKNEAGKFYVRDTLVTRAIVMPCQQCGRKQ